LLLTTAPGRRREDVAQRRRDVVLVVVADDHAALGRRRRRTARAGGRRHDQKAEADGRECGPTYAHAKAPSPFSPNSQPELPTMRTKIQGQAANPARRPAA